MDHRLDVDDQMLADRFWMSGSQVRCRCSAALIPVNALGVDV